jgi:hypothetical protein
LGPIAPNSAHTNAAKTAGNGKTDQQLNGFTAVAEGAETTEMVFNLDRTD